MKIEKNSRQMPSTATITKEKQYCDLLYAWLQCNSERISVVEEGRRISKKDVKWTKIERDFTRIDGEGKEYKEMSRKTIAKYFEFLVEKGLVQDSEDGYYYLRVLDPQEATLIEFYTLQKLMNVLKQDAISVYSYLFNRYYANGLEPFYASISSIKEFIGRATDTTSNNIVIVDMIDILKRLGLMEFELINKDGKSQYKFYWVKNKLD